MHKPKPNKLLGYFKTTNSIFNFATLNNFIFNKLDVNYYCKK